MTSIPIDPNQPSTPNTDANAQLQAKFDQLSKKYDEQIKMFNKFYDKVAKEDPKIAAEFKKTKDSIDNLGSSFASLRANLENVTPRDFLATIQGGFQKAKIEAAKFSIELAGYMKDAATSTGTFGAALNAAIPLMAALGEQKIVEKLPFLDLQQKLKDAEKQALQTAMAFGSIGREAPSFDQAKGYVEHFNSVLTDAILVTKTSGEEVRSTANAFKAMGLDAFTSLTGLTVASNQLGTALNAVNSALLISKATGMDSAKVAGLMDEMYMNLGLSTEAAVQSFGRIADVAKRSGLGFERTADTITGLTRDLKFWGTTVEGVAPLFDTFSRSMQGIGQKGLTPELLKTFVNGIQQMSFGTKALLGMQSPGMRAGGALRGGLQMEEALAKGDFGKIAENLTGTLKQFGGQQILTRQQALESPGSERQYMVQRQMLSQLMGINDPATQDKMLATLSDIDKHGMKTNTDANQALGNLIKSGKSVADETTSILDDANFKVESAIYTSGNKIYEAITALPEHLGFDKFFGDLNSILEDSIRMGGIDKKGIEAAANLLTKRIQEREEKLQKDLSPEERTKTEKEVGQLRGTQLALGTIADFKTDDFAGKQLTDKELEGIVGKRMEPVTGRIKKLEGFQRLAPKDFTADMFAELDTLRKDQEKMADQFREQIRAASQIQTPLEAFKKDRDVQGALERAKKSTQEVQEDVRTPVERALEPVREDEETVKNMGFPLPPEPPPPPPLIPEMVGPPDMRTEATMAAQELQNAQALVTPDTTALAETKPLKQDIEFNTKWTADITDDGKITLSLEKIISKMLKGELAQSSLEFVENTKGSRS